MKDLRDQTIKTCNGTTIQRYNEPTVQRLLALGAGMEAAVDFGEAGGVDVGVDLRCGYVGVS